MEKTILSVFLILLLFPLSSAFSQKTDNMPTLSVVLTSDSPFIYKDDEGYTVVVGAVENTNKLTSVANVRIHVNFYDDVNPQPLEFIKDGTTSLKVIPPLGKSPYMIKSNSPNPDITSVSVSLVGFNPAPSKSKQQSVELSDITLGDTLHFSGMLKNGAAPITNANVYLAFYDNFIPPRIIGVSTIPIGDVEANKIINFSFNEKIQQRSVGFFLFSESNVFYSDSKDVKIPVPEIMTKLVTISSVSLLDSQGIPLSEIKLGSTVKIQSDSWIQFSADQTSSETPYSYYVQIKQSGVPFVEFIGKYDGVYIGAGKQFPSVDWIPENTGLFFIETFVWDRNHIPIADQGPPVLVLIQ